MQPDVGKLLAVRHTEKVGIYLIAIKEDEFLEFSEYIKRHYGIYLKPEKKTLVEGRLGPLMNRMNFGSLKEYMQYVLSDKSGQALAVMLNRITTNHTFFMREAAHFQYFKETVLPYLTQTVHDHDLRIWSAACSSGEEPYTLAMTMDEYFGTKKAAWDTKILATDLSREVLDLAKEGIYSTDKMSGLPEHWVKKYFKETIPGKFAISDKIKSEVIFRPINLMDTVYPFKKKMHVVFCRNVMIYFDTDTKERLVDHLYEITEPGGFLFIGHSEGLRRETTRYKYIMPAVYRKE